METAQGSIVSPDDHDNPNADLEAHTAQSFRASSEGGTA